jgi:5-oxoprolinase (ATP-hydrolysing)
MDQILVPYDAGLLSAVGMGNAIIERFSIRQVLKPLHSLGSKLKRLIHSCGKEAIHNMMGENIPRESIYIREVLIYLRFLGQETSLEIAYQDQDIQEAFQDKYKNTYGHWIENRPIEVESIKVIAAEKIRTRKTVRKSLKPYVPNPQKYQKCWLNGSWNDIPVFVWEKLKAGARIKGPALLVSHFTTVLLKNSWYLDINAHHQAMMYSVQSDSGSTLEMADTSRFDKAVHIELFTNRFYSIAEEMGALLRRSSFSVNIKERLDYSCALLDAEGELIVNAPHIPVHLGGLGLCVRSIIREFDVKPDQIFITNHPGFGGSHLPDITLVAPVFDDAKNLAGFVANRAHHAELGGKRPGSMPPDASNLLEEGKVIPPFCILEEGQVYWDKIQDLLISEPFPTRNLEENLADLTGALASIRAGTENLKKLCRRYGISTLKYYMDYLKEYANLSLKKKQKKFKRKILTATEYLDDGHQIRVTIHITEHQLNFDFKGSSALHPGNLNATPAIVRSAVLYVLRLLVDDNIPLNEGLMRSVKITLPECFLNPTFPSDPAKCPAVVGGNTETSQRLVDTLLKAFELSACSQGTMNNFVFGNDRFSYYETIGGGVGATHGYHGADAVHQHMTNTRITDPEVLEFRYPVKLDYFRIRKNSGGSGTWNGGSGIERKVTFLEPLDMTVLTQHRVEAPYGLKGGSNGATGSQFITRADGRIETLQGIDAQRMHPGDSITILTPGGGGYGDNT